MKRLNISGYIRKQKCPVTYGSEHSRFTNVLNRNFNSNSPMQKIVTKVIITIWLVFLICLIMKY